MKSHASAMLVLFIAAAGTMAASSAIVSPVHGPVIDVSTSSDRNGHPDVAWTGRTEELWVVWELERTLHDHRTSIMAARLDTSGYLIDAWPVAWGLDEHRLSPALAFSPVQDDGLVAYTRDAGTGDGSDIWARAAYQPHERATPELLIAGGAYDQSLPAIAYNPINDEYVIVAVNQLATGLEQVIAIRLSAADPTSPLANEVVASGNGIYPSVAIAHNAAWNQYLITYVFSASQAESELVAKQAGYSLANIGSSPEITINSDPTTFPFEAVVAATGDEYLVAWLQNLTTSPDTEVRARRVDTLGGPLGNPAGMPVAAVSDPNSPRHLDVSAGTDGYLVVWGTDNDTDSNLVSRYILAGSDTLGTGHMLADGPNEQSTPAVACSTGLDCLVVHIDQLLIEAPQPLDIIRGRYLFQKRIFLSGFETGTTDQWSTAVE